MTSRPSFDSRLKYKHLTTLLQFSGAIVGSTPWASFPTVAHWIMRQNHLSFCNTTSLALSHRMGRWLFKDPPSGGGRSERHIPIGKPLLLVVKSHIPTPRASTHAPFPYHFPPRPPPSHLLCSGISPFPFEEARLFTLLATHAFVSRDASEKQGSRDGEGERWERSQMIHKILFCHLKIALLGQRLTST